MTRCQQAAESIIILAMLWSAAALGQNIPIAEDAKSNVRSWGPEVNGLSLSIGVNKTTYFVGEPIPLHVAFSNIRASKAMTLDACKRVVLTVRNEKGDKLEQVDHDLSCNFSGPCDQKVAPGFVVTGEQDLTYDYRLPPGTYTVTAEWSPFAYLGDLETEYCFGPQGKDQFHVHSNPVTIRITASNRP